MNNESGTRSEMRFPVSKRSGFTLIEILIILVIIAQLTAILLLVFSRVRDSARRVTCASNLKQIGLAINMYAADNDDYYPHRKDYSAPFCAWADRLQPYVKETALFECPSTRKLSYIPGCPPASPTEIDDVGQHVEYDGSYDMNLLIRSAIAFPHEATFSHPVDTISVLDGGGQMIFSFDNDMSTLEGVEHAGLKPPRHFRGYNVLFVDGHVKWMKYEKVFVPSLWKVSD
jgi:prepilin-type processing-associated H-X9-DG protein